MQFLLESQNILYLIASVLFVFGIKGMTHPRTAVRGNLIGLAGMLLAMAVVLIDWDHVQPGWHWWVAGLVVGSLIGIIAARMVQMTAMPEMVALFNGSGGLASMLVAGAYFHRLTIEAADTVTLLASATASGVNHTIIEAFNSGQISALDLAVYVDKGEPMQTYIATAASGIIGAVTFTGSVLAFLKLREWVSGRPRTNPVLKFGNAISLLLSLVFAVILALDPSQIWAYWALSVWVINAASL